MTEFKDRAVTMVSKNKEMTVVFVVRAQDYKRFMYASQSAEGETFNLDVACLKVFIPKPDGGLLSISPEKLYDN